MLWSRSFSWVPICHSYSSSVVVEPDNESHRSLHSYFDNVYDTINTYLVSDPGVSFLFVYGDPHELYRQLYRVDSHFQRDIVALTCCSYADWNFRFTTYIPDSVRFSGRFVMPTNRTSYTGVATLLSINRSVERSLDTFR